MAEIARRLRGRARLRGIGLITGRRVAVEVGPAPAGHGLRFRRVDRRGAGGEAMADWRHFVEVPNCTCLEAPTGARFHMVEHCMAALAAAGVEDALIEVDGPELPHLDGSARPYCDALDTAGLEIAPAGRRIEITAPLAFNFGRTRYRFEPADRFELDLTISLNHFGRQEWRGPVEWRVFEREIAPARSFMRLTLKNGLQLIGVWARKHGEAGVVGLWRDRAVNPFGLRMPDEMVRHRVIDLLGDMRLAGAPIRGRVVAFGPAHKKNHDAVVRLMENTDVWRWSDAHNA